MTDVLLGVPYSAVKFYRGLNAITSHQEHVTDVNALTLYPNLLSLILTTSHQTSVVTSRRIENAVLISENPS